MRELKFRAWVDNGEGHRLMIYDRGNVVEFFDATVGCEIMQYTGLIVDGVEVYEGDLMERKNASGGTHVCEVRWDSIEAGFRLFKGNFAQWGAINYRAKVVGNIYENA